MASAARDRNAITIRGTPDVTMAWLTETARKSGISRTQVILAVFEEARRREWEFAPQPRGQVVTS